SEDENIEAFIEVAHEKMIHKKQPDIKTAMITWMIDDCQPFYLLQNESFKEFIKVASPGFKSSPNDEPYIGVIARWLDPKDWTLKEGLLACKKITGRHTSKNIQNAIAQIIEWFQLKQKLFAATMDNSVNIVKAIQLIDISYIPCFAHTLYLCVSKDLGAAKAFKNHVTNHILFFNNSPKQTEHLRDTQCKLNYSKVYEILLDVKTR
ncbi:13814_t:CDS:2, partial [Gigaspora margarita]